MLNFLIRTKSGANKLDLYLSRKHDELLASTLDPGSYKKISSFAIVDGFTVEITEDQVMCNLSSYKIQFYLSCFDLSYDIYTYYVAYDVFLFLINMLYIQTGQCAQICKRSENCGERRKICFVIRSIYIDI